MEIIRRTCVVTGKEFDITPNEQRSLQRMGELNPAVGEPFPLPRVHPLEHMRQVLAFANVIQVYMVPSAISGKPTISRFNPDFGYKICTQEEFYSDAVDNTEVGMDFDFSRPFFEQWKDLLHKVYLMPSNSMNCEASSYVNGVMNIKRSYLVFTSIDLENCMYCEGVYRGSDCVDCVRSSDLQYCYDCSTCTNCYECQHCSETKNSKNCFACYDCTGCSDCYGCVGLSHQQYCIFNEQKSKDEYEAFMQEQNLGRYQERQRALKTCEEFIQSKQHIANTLINTENCTGFYVKDSKDSVMCFNARGLQDCGYICEADGNNKDCWKGWVFNSELCYLSGGLGTRGAYATYSTEGGENCLYSYLLFQKCNDCFGCISLKKKSYCILNKQYTKEEYLTLVPKIIAHMKQTGEWGEFFPPTMSPHAYAETITDLWLESLPEEEVQRRGYRMDVIKEPTVSLPSASLVPEDIQDDQVVHMAGRPLRCEETSATYTLQAPEIAFYKKYQIPLPHLHWKQRFKKLYSKRRKLPAV